MNPEYVVLAGWLWRLSGKQVVLWYVHREVSWRLRFSLLFVHKVLTVIKESLGIEGRKIVEVGHGIDTGVFHYANRAPSAATLTILSVGRITKIKNLDSLIRAAKILSGRLNKKLTVNIVGGPATHKDEDYLKYIRKLVSDLDLESIVHFVGPVPYSKILPYYCRSHIAVNLCPTGGIDKSVLESMACGVPCLVANQAFTPYFGAWSEKLIFEYNNANDLAQKIAALVSSSELPSLSSYLRVVVEEHHNLKVLMTRIARHLWP